MLRSGNTIRLTSTEQETLDMVTCTKGMAGPKSVQEHNARLDQAIDNYTASDTAEAQLLAALAEDLKVQDQA